MASSPKYLIQEVEGKEPHIYAWTPVLAKKEGLRPISAKDAEKILRRQKAKATLRKEQWQTTEAEQAEAQEIIDEERAELLEEAEAEDFVSDEKEDNKILDSLNPSDNVQTPEGQGKKLEITQEDLLEEDSAAINRLRVKHSVEEYMLRKYKMEMLNMETVEEMKQQAIEMLRALAATGSLYSKK